MGRPVVTTRGRAPRQPSDPKRGNTMRILDLFCGAGGAGVGYHRGGFEVMGVDIQPMPNYPYAFIQTSALQALVTVDFVAGFDAIHASPPCQASSNLTKGTNRGRQYVNLIPAVRELLNLTGLPYVIENVQGSALRRDQTLCGEMFGLDVIRHRYFELGGWSAPAPGHKSHRGKVQGWRHGTYYPGPYFAVYGEGGGKGTVTEWQQAMGIDWTSNRKEIAEAIPPAYTEWIGGQLLAHLKTREKAAA